MNRPILTYEEYGRLFLSQSAVTKENSEDVTVETQEERARVFMAETNTCPVYPGTTDPDLTNVNVDSVKAIAEREKHNPATSQAISCLLSKLINNMTEEEWRRWRMRHMFTNLKKIGAESSYGTVYETEFIGNKNDLFVVKTAQRESETDLYHEVVISVGALNRLREFTPNFAYLYGYFSCTNPNTIPPTRVAGGHCSKGRESLYLVYEKIPNSLAFGDFVLDSGNSIQDIMKLAIQVLFSLQIAYERYNFTHYDLHEGNILVQELDKEYIFSYKNPSVGSTNLYMKSKYMAKIIDYGLSFATIDGVDYGRHRGLTDRQKRLGMINNKHERYSQFAEKPFPATDCYKLLLNLGAALWDRFGDTGDVMTKKIATDIFNVLMHGSMSIDDKMDIAGKYNWSMPYKPEFVARYNYGYFIGLLSNIYRKYIPANDITMSSMPEDDTPRWSCDSLGCSNLEGLLNGFVSPGHSGLKITDSPSLLYYLDSGKDISFYVFHTIHSEMGRFLDVIAENDVKFITEFLNILTTYVKHVARKRITSLDIISVPDKGYQLIRALYIITAIEEVIDAAKKIKDKYRMSTMYDEIERNNFPSGLQSATAAIDKIRIQVRKDIDILPDKTKINEDYNLSLLYDAVSI